jgi:hypothetical protein
MEMLSAKGSTQRCGYSKLEIHGRTAERVRAVGGAGEWRKPIHGTAVLMAADGKTVLGHIRTLGIMLPLKDRRYALKIKGVVFHRVQPMLGKEPIRSDLAPYDTMEAARRAGLKIIKRMEKA